MLLFTLTSHLVFQFWAAHTQHIFKNYSDCRIKLSGYNANRKTSVTPLYKKYGVLKLADLCNYEMAKIMYQFSKQTLPSHLNYLFDPSLPYMNAALDLKLSKIFIFLTSQPPGVKIFLNIKDQKFGTL